MIAFGPVPSRRLGKSLGINNITSPKVCSYNCIYCQVGTTRNQSEELRDFFNPEDILKEVTTHLEKLQEPDYPDYLTFVSNGEPTLDRQLGQTARMLKGLGFPIALISNASTLKHEVVRQSLAEFDWISLKMDAPDQDTWRQINRPHPSLNFDQTMQCIYLFSNRYRGILCTETMLVQGINDRKETLEQLAGMIAKLSPAKAYISIPTRPPAVKNVSIPTPEKINEAWQIFHARHPETELLTSFEGTDTGFTGNAFQDILETTAVHPLREDAMKRLLERNRADFTVVNQLREMHLIKAVSYQGHTFYLRNYLV